jgi:hypothetical protein
MDDRSSRKPPGPRVGRIRRRRSPITLVAAGQGGLRFSFWGWDSVAPSGVRLPSLNVVRPPVRTLDAVGAAHSVRPAPLRSRFGNYFSNTLKGLWLPGRPPCWRSGKLVPTTARLRLTVTQDDRGSRRILFVRSARQLARVGVPPASRSPGGAGVGDRL